MASVVLYLVAAKGVGAFKEMVLAAKYGTGPVLDAYAVAFNLFTTPVSIFASMGAVLVPLLVRLARTSPEDQTLFFRECLGLTLLGGVVIALACAGGIVLAVRVHWLGVDATVAHYLIAMALPLSAMVPMGAVAGLLATRLMSESRFVNALLEAAPSVFLAAGALMIGHPGMGVLLWGTLLGFAAYVVALAALQPKPLINLAPRLRFDSPHWKETGSSFGLMLVAQAIITMSGPADQIIVSHLGPGANATLGYANRLLMLLNGLGATAVARATLPVFAEAHIRNPGGEARLAMRWMKILFVLSCIAVLVGALAAPLGVRMLFQRGAFTAKDTAAVAEAFRYGLLQLPFYFASIIIVQLLVSRREYGVFIISNSLSLGLKIAFGLALAPIFGIKGVMLASAVMYAVSFAALSIYGWRRLAHAPNPVPS